uniref:Uncharacterized protein n=1 Tax=Glossina pallidipes TaxID=7398 RepID=A0A1A9Z5W5_GLOPL
MSLQSALPDRLCTALNQKDKVSNRESAVNVNLSIFLSILLLQGLKALYRRPNGLNMICSVYDNSSDWLLRISLHCLRIALVGMRDEYDFKDGLKRYILISIDLFVWLCVKTV